MRHHSLLTTCTLCLAIVGFSAVHSRADIAMTAQKVGSDVVFSFSGSIDLTGLGSPLTSSSRGAIYPVNAYMEFGPVESLPDSTALYLNSVVTANSAKSFGIGGYQVPTSAKGSRFSVNNNSIKLPLNYASGTQISGSITYKGKNFTDLQVTKSSTPYVWNLTNGEKIKLSFLDPVSDVDEIRLALERQIRKLKREIRIAKELEQTALVKRLTRKLRLLKAELAAL